MEDEVVSMHPLISWRSVLAGVLLAFFTMCGLVGLSLAFGGIKPREDIFINVWFLSSALIAIFTGSYFAARVSRFQTGRIGSAQGLVIAALFLGVFLFPTLTSVMRMSFLFAESALSATGWAMFLLVMLGALASVLGGALGSVANFRNPLSREHFPAHHHFHAEVP